MTCLRPIMALFAGLAGVASGYNFSAVTEHCLDLYDFTGDAGLEAPTKVVNVSAIAANTTTGVPAYCSLEAHIPSNGALTRYVLYIPSEGKDWAGIFATHGCGGSCGNLGLDYPYGYGTGLGYGAELVKKGYVISQNDLGHNMVDTNDTLSTWNAFRFNRTNEINFSYLSTHLTTVSGKALTEFYYGTPAKRSIFRGGSTGGRQALVSAARYPHDFDGIICAYAASNETATGAILSPYLRKVSWYPNGTNILTTADASSLNAGALAACDENDGVVDGFIDLSYACDFDPVEILCSNFTSSSKGGCLANMDKVEAARAMYKFPSNSFTDKLAYARNVPGSELSWGDYTSNPSTWSPSFVQNAAFQTDLPLNWTLDQYDWDMDPYRTGFMEDIYTADFAGLRLFREKGGKLLNYQGWADGVVAPGFTVELYQQTINEIGYQRTSDFQRLFIYPGMAHIDVHRNANGTTGWRHDYYDTLNEWLDTGVAPDRLIIEHWNYTTGAHIDYRPYFAYPQTPKYVGGEGGSLDNPDDWIGVVPPKEARGIDYPWKED